jgi:hypothetical protein
MAGRQGSEFRVQSSLHGRSTPEARQYLARRCISIEAQSIRCQAVGGQICPHLQVPALPFVACGICDGIAYNKRPSAGREAFLAASKPRRNRVSP